MSTLVSLGSNAHSVGSARNPDRTFFAAMAGVMLAIVLVGFAPSFYLSSFLDAKPLRPVVHIHGFLFTLWPVLFITQSMLVRTDRIRLHRALGVGGAVLAVLMVISGYVVSAYRPPIAVGSRAASAGEIAVHAFLLGQIYALLLFATLVTLAMWFRRNSGVHKRLVLIATISILNAATARILLLVGIEPLPYLGMVATWGPLLLALAIYDVVTQRRLHPATLWGGLFVALRLPVFAQLGFTDQWQAIATWLTSY